MKLLRTHLSILYDDLWAEHIRLSTGRIVKPFKDRHKFGSQSLSKGFKVQKPTQFDYLDELIKTLNWDFQSHICDLIELADNRMMMGDYRYGSIKRQNLDNYDVESEFFRRLKVAKETTNLEYVVDAYNMLRIEYYKKKNIYQIKDLIKHHFNPIMSLSFKDNWPLISIDDGIHAKEKF